MRNLLVKSLFAMAALGLSMNSFATSSDANHKSQHEMNDDKESIKHNHEDKNKRDEDRKYDEKNLKEGKSKEGRHHKHHKKAHKHHHHKHHPHQHKYHEQGPAVREAAPRVPDDNSGKKMDMDEYR